MHPYSEDQFFSNDWEQKPVHISGAGLHGGSEILGLAALNALLFESSFRTDEVKVALQGKIVPPASYQLPASINVMGRRPPDCVNPTALLNWLSEGATLVFAQLDRKSPKLVEIKTMLEDRLSAQIIANVFLSGRAAQGFATHYDSHDVFVLQLEGQKTWSIYDNPIELPTKSQAFGSAAIAPGPVSQTVTLNPGDILYLPRGYFHAAATSESHSLHVTFGVHPYLWADFITDLFAELASENIALRRALPRDFTAPDAAQNHAATIRNLIAGVLEGSELPGLANALIRKARQAPAKAAHRPLQNQLLEILDCENLTLDTPLFRRDPALPLTLSRAGGTVTLSFQGCKLLFDADLHALLTSLQTRQSLTGTSLLEFAAAPLILPMLKRLLGAGILTSRPPEQANSPATRN